MRRIKLILAVAAAMAVMVLAAAPAMADGRFNDSGNNVRFHDGGDNSFTVFFTTTNSDLDGDFDVIPGSLSFGDLDLDFD